MQSRYWCLTDNVNTHQDYWYAKSNDVGCTYLCAQPERVARLHVQGFVVYPRKKRPGAVRSDFPEAHVEAMRGTPAQAAAYCKKDDSWTGDWRVEYGELPEHEPGKRTDLENIRDLCKESKSLVQIIDQVPQALRYMKEIRIYSNLLAELAPPAIEPLFLRPWQEDFFALLLAPVIARRIFWLWSGLSGVGKTTTMRLFMERYPGQVCLGSRKLADLLFAFDVRTHRVIWFDLSRSDPLDAEMTTVLEQVSNASYLMASKYESCMKLVKVHVVVTCNRPPPEERLPQRLVEMRLLQDGSVWDAELQPDVVPAAMNAMGNNGNGGFLNYQDVDWPGLFLNNA